MMLDVRHLKAQVLKLMRFGQMLTLWLMNHVSVLKMARPMLMHGEELLLIPTLGITVQLINGQQVSDKEIIL